MAVAAITLGGMALASGVMGAFGASQQASAQAMAQEISQRNANFQAKWNKAIQDRNAMRVFQANLERNMQIEKSANKERALSELYLDQGFANQKSQLSKQTAQVNSQFIGTLTGRGIDQSSGTARAMLRQNLEALGNNMVALKLNYRNAYNDIVNQQQVRLSQRASTIAPDTGVFLPSTGGIANGSSSALITGLIQAGLQGAATGYAAQLKFGNGGGGFNPNNLTPENTSGGMMGPPNPNM